MHHAINKQALSQAFFSSKAEALSGWSGPVRQLRSRLQVSYDVKLAKSLLAVGYSTATAKIDFIIQRRV